MFDGIQCTLGFHCWCLTMISDGLPLPSCPHPFSPSFLVHRTYLAAAAEPSAADRTDRAEWAVFVLRDDETIDLDSPPGATLPGRLDGVAEPRLLTVLERQPEGPALLSLVFLCPEKCSVERMRFMYSLAKGALQEHMERLGLSGQSNVVSGRFNIYAPYTVQSRQDTRRSGW